MFAPAWEHPAARPRGAEPHLKAPSPGDRAVALPTPGSLQTASASCIHRQRIYNHPVVTHCQINS